MKKLSFLLVFTLFVTGQVFATVTDTMQTARQKTQYKEILRESDRKLAERNQAWLDAQKKKVKYDTIGLAQYRYEYKLLNQERKEVIIEFIKAHPGYIVSIAALSDVVGYLPDDIRRYDLLLKSLSKEVRMSDDGVKLRGVIDNFLKVAIGEKAPDFIINDTVGKPVKLSNFREKYVLVDFWASWCGPCREENPAVVKAYQRFKDKKFDILSISLDQPGKHDAWIRAIHEDKLTWTNVSDLKYWNCEAAKLYCVRSIPQNFLIDPDGVIIAANLRGTMLEETLEKLLGK